MPANEEHVIEQDHARDRPDSWSIIMSSINLCDEGLSDDFTSEEYCDYVHMIRETCVQASTYSISTTRRRLRKQGQNMAQFIFIFFNLFM